MSTMHELLKFTPFHIIGSVQTIDTYHKHDPEIISGLSTAVKPVDRIKNSIFLETDTGRFFVWDGATWTQTTEAASSTLTFADGSNIVVGTTTGTKIGTAATQKLGFFNATPVVQRTGIANVNASTVDNTYGQQENDVITDLRTKVNAIIQVLEDLGLTATV